MAKFTDAIVTTLKAYFETGDRPSEAQFAEWIEAIQAGIEEHDHAGLGDGDAAKLDADSLDTAAPGADSVNVAASSKGTAHSVAKSDHTHNLDEAITPTWAGEHDFQAAATFQEVVSLAATKATTLLTVNQTGTGDVAEFQDGGNATVRIPDGGGIVLVPQAGGVSAIAGLLYYDNTAAGFERLKLKHEGHGYPVPVDPRNGLRNVSVCTTYV